MSVKGTDFDENFLSDEGRKKKTDDAIDCHHYYSSSRSSPSSSSPSNEASNELIFRFNGNHGFNDGESQVGEEGSEEERCRMPLDYQLLPEEFFRFKGIPLPLVSKPWLKSVEEKLKWRTNREESDDDSLPLAILKGKLKETNSGISLEGCDPTSDSCSLTHSNSNKGRPVSEKEDSLQTKKKQKRKKGRDKQFKTDSLGNRENSEKFTINRKRGRPRKSERDSNQDGNEFSNEASENYKDGVDDFWADDSEDSFDLDFPENRIKSQEEGCEGDGVAIGLNRRDHDYSKLDDDSNVNDGEEGEGVQNVVGEKQKRKSQIQGVTNKNAAKISYPCLECGKSFSAASTLKNHKRIHNGTLLKCTECHKGFITKYLLKCHMRIHNGDLFKCNKCDKGFTTAELLKVHSRGHTGDRPFVCNTCGRSFPSASNLSQHKNIHNTEKKFLCFQCGSSFSQKRCLDGHMLTHAEKNHICNVCGKLWARKSDLIEHMRVHTGVKPYCCSICPQKFTQTSSLKRHQIVHMDIKPIQCPSCSKMFKCQEYYDRHMRKHEKESVQLVSTTTTTTTTTTTAEGT